MNMDETQKSIDDWGATAILVVDIQNDFCDDSGKFAEQGLDVKPAQEVAERIDEFLVEARKLGIPIIFSKQIESQEVTPLNLQRQFFRGKLKEVCSPESWGSDFYKVQPSEGEVVVEKNTYDVFSNPELKQKLDELGIRTLVVTGVNTDVCVDTTVRSAFTNGYQIVVPKDLVATMNMEAQKHFLAVFDRFFGDVTDAQTTISQLKSILK
jgi:ureidoacrylate peracid hydrolase